MKKRRLGKDGPLVSEIGLGCAGMGEIYGPTDDRESVATLHRALELGVNFLDTSDAYGPHTNERLLGNALKGRRDQVVLATKVGIYADPKGPGGMGVNGHPDYIRSAIDDSLRRLQVDFVDLYYLHRVDPRVPVEDSIGAMAEVVAQGKARWLGLSEASPATLARAHCVHSITALESEYSLWTRDPENGVLEACRQYGVGFVAFSPLGRGFLAGALKGPEEFNDKDIRHGHPRFQKENFQKNNVLLDQMKEIARRKGCRPSQLALAWVLAQGEDIIPIPGTKRRSRLEENLGAAEVVLTGEDRAELEAIFAPGAVAGARYSEAAKKVWSS